mmetsp:Transcript_21613/g.69883  ORF Transcript_21613/g.69883 Transcript_21613/m.69883 type:complete len:108 (-) Transcript_21613:1676-1999(-)
MVTTTLERVRDRLARFALWPVRVAVSHVEGTRLAAERRPPDEVAAAAVHVAAWLRVGALRDAADGVAGQAIAQPTLATHWTCPICAEKLIATADVIRAHRDQCSKSE